MLSPELITTLLCFIVTIFFWRRQHLAKPLRFQAGPSSAAAAPEFDVIVIGGGAGGCAAARAALDSGASSVVVVESGSGTIGSMHEAVSFATEFAASKVDFGVRCPKIFEKGPSDGVPYPRGHVLGGTSSIDWAMHLPTGGAIMRRRGGAGATETPALFFDATPADDGAVKGPVPRSSIAVTLATAVRSPLSWAFAEACGTVLGRKVLPKAGEQALQRVGAQPVFLRVNDQGTRSFPHFALLADAAGAGSASSTTPLAKGLSLWCASHAERIVTERDAKDQLRAVGVVVRGGKDGCEPITVRCRRGVVVAAGVVFTPPLLRQLKLLPSSNPESIGRNFVDSISVPLIYQARPGISNDACNVQSMKNIIAWYAFRRGAILSTICDTAFVADVPECSGAQVLVLLQPSGGYRGILYKKWNIAPALGVFKEGFTFHVLVHKLGDATIAGSLGGVSVAPTTGEGATSLHRVEVSSATWSEPLSQRVEAILAHGIKLCRDVATTAPLSQLTTGREAIDCSLLEGLTFDKKIAYKLLYQKPLKAGKRGAEAADAPLRKALADIGAAAQTPGYVQRYIAKHARLAGYGSGTTFDALEVGSTRVRGTTNIFVGDTSAIGAGEAEELGIVVAGGVAAAAEVGVCAGRGVMTVSHK